MTQGTENCSTSNDHKRKARAEEKSCSFFVPLIPCKDIPRFFWEMALHDSQNKAWTFLLWVMRFLAACKNPLQTLAVE